MMVIEHLKLHRRNRYVWLKKVTGVDLTQHCARCLLGQYHPLFKPHHSLYQGLKLSGGETPYYLCTVDGTYVHHFHLAFREKEGAVIDIKTEDAEVRITNAEELPIDKGYVDYNDPHYQDKAYITCRNWWFAHWYARHGKKREEAAQTPQDAPAPEAVPAPAPEAAAQSQAAEAAPMASTTVKCGNGLDGPTVECCQWWLKNHTNMPKDWQPIQAAFDMRQQNKAKHGIK